MDKAIDARHYPTRVCVSLQHEGGRSSAHVSRGRMRPRVEWWSRHVFSHKPDINLILISALALSNGVGRWLR